MLGGVKLLMAGAALAASFIATQAEASWFGYPKALKAQFERTGFQTPPVALSDSAYFSLLYPDNCSVHRSSFRSLYAIELTSLHVSDLVKARISVNHDAAAWH